MQATDQRPTRTVVDWKCSKEYYGTKCIKAIEWRFSRWYVFMTVIDCVILNSAIVLSHCYSTAYGTDYKITRFCHLRPSAKLTLKYRQGHRQSHHLKAVVWFLNSNFSFSGRIEIGLQAVFNDENHIFAYLNVFDRHAVGMLKTKFGSRKLE